MLYLINAREINPGDLVIGRYDQFKLVIYRHGSYSCDYIGYLLGDNVRETFMTIVSGRSTAIEAPHA